MRKLFLVLSYFAFAAPAEAQLYKDHKHIVGADTLIRLCQDSLSTMFIGFYFDDDELDIFYQVQTGSACEIKHPGLQIFDRWGNIICDVKEKFKRWYSNAPPFSKVDIFVYKFY